MTRTEVSWSSYLPVVYALSPLRVVLGRATGRTVLAGYWGAVIPSPLSITPALVDLLVV